LCIKTAIIVGMDKVDRREVWDLRRDEVEVLAKCFAAWADGTIVNRMVKQGFLEADPSTSSRNPRVRCTERGAEAVDYFRQRKWIK
jgi:hypothetical protein